MKKINLLAGVAVTLLATTALTGCNDEVVQPQSQSSGGELLSRGAYDYPAVEWDNVDKIAVACNLQPSTTELSLPWDSGQSGNNGIPEDWLDSERRNPDPKCVLIHARTVGIWYATIFRTPHNRPNILVFTTSIPECFDYFFMR